MKINEKEFKVFSIIVHKYLGDLKCQLPRRK